MTQSRIFKWGLALMLSLFLTGSAWAAGIQSTVPEDGATDVSVNTAITVTFSGEMDGTTITEDTFYVTTGTGYKRRSVVGAVTTTGYGPSTVAGEVTYTGMTATFQAASSLLYETTYTVTVTAGVTDAEGNSLAEDYQWSFTTESEGTTPEHPEVTSVNATDDNITVHFSKEMDCNTVSGDTFFVKARIPGLGYGILAGDTTCNGSVIMFQPYADLLSALNYSLNITQGLKDTQGNGLAAAYEAPLIITEEPKNQGVVSVSEPLAAEAGAKVLEAGGNAIDAAAAIQFALNVTEPHCSGIGGGGFMMIYLAETDETFIMESREMAPAAATPDMFMDNGEVIPFEERSTSGIAVGIPGTLMGVATALERYGTISLADAMQSGIELAENGFVVNKTLAAATDDPRTAYQPETAALFRRPDGSPLQEGDMLVQPDLANTFRLIAANGIDVFYQGEIAEAIVDAQKRTRAGDAGIGRMTLADLAAYTVNERQPTVGDYRGYTLKSMSPPSSGGLTVIQMLKMLERFPLGDETQGFGFGSVKTLHVMSEAMRLAYADRAVWMGDNDFVPMPMIGLLADEYVAKRSALIQEDTRMETPSHDNPWEYEPGATRRLIASATPYQEEDNGHTTHFSVIDQWGNIVSYTTTIEMYWGTGIMVPGYGFLLNNELTDFNGEPTYNEETGNPGANDVAPHKRPRSSMSPSILFKDGKPIAAYGSPGGSTIINTVLQITLNLIDHGMTIQEAIDAPRISVHNAEGTWKRMEAGFSEATIQGLIDLGHYFTLEDADVVGSVQGIYVDPETGEQSGGADSRREGTVIKLPRD